MPITPAGNPLWLRNATGGAATIENFGGHLEKQNYLGRRGIDAITDLDAESVARLTADAVAIANTVPIAVVSFECIDTGSYELYGVTFPAPHAPWITGVHLCTGVRLVRYLGDRARATLPSATRNGTGDVTIEFPVTMTDAYGVEGALTIAHVKPGCAIATSVQRVVAEIVSATSVRVRVFDEADAAVPNASVSGLRIY